MTTLKGVFWDVDGTLADTEMEGHRVSFNYSFNKVGINWYWNRSTYAKLLNYPGGVNRIKQYSNMQNMNLDDSYLNEIHVIKQKYYKQLLGSDLIKLRIGVERVFNELHQNGIQQWIVTTSSNVAVQALLANLPKSIKNNFKGVVAHEDVKYKKPNSECYLKALKSSKLDPSNVIVIEDSLVGLQSAVGANLKCLITLTDYDTNDLSLYSQAKAIVNHLGDETNTSVVMKGTPVHNKMVSISYLNSLLL